MEPVLALLRANALARAREHLLELPAFNATEKAAVLGVQWEVERNKVDSIATFANLSRDQIETADAFIVNLSGLVGISEIDPTDTEPNDRVYRRNPNIKGPMHAFGYSYIEEHLPAEEYASLKLSGVLAYETLNLVNGKRTVAEIHDWLLAQCGPECAAGSGLLTPEYVADYLSALEKIGVIL